LTQSVCPLSAAAAIAISIDVWGVSMTSKPRRPVEELLGGARPLHRLAGISGQQIVLRTPDSLRTNPRNARTHSKKQIRQLARSIKAAGFIGAIIIDETDMVLAGHARLAACKHLEMNLVPTLKATGLNEAQKRAFVLADNKIAENAGWDREILTVELGELAELLPPLNWDLTLTGFEPAEIDALFADHGEPKPDPADSLPPLPADAVTRRGDLWVGGDQRILCGDARSSTDLDRLMGDARARMVFADVPYNQRIAHVQGRGRTKHPEFAQASGEMTPPQHIAFLEKALRNAARVSIDGAVHYVCIDWRHAGELITAGRSVYPLMLNICVWAKTNAGQGSFYRSQHELVVVFAAGAASHQNNIQLGRFGRNRSNLWTYAGINSFGTGRMEMLAMHPTVKPVALVADAMRDCTTKGDVVLDPFLGSGTTVLAAEKIGRRGYGIDCEPRYVDVAVQRWEAYTKLEAVLEGDGRTYGEIKAERLTVRERSEPRTVVPSIATTKPGTPDVPTADGSASATSGHDWVALCEEVAVTPPAGGQK
jgi:DNA modification methylase